MVSPGPTFCWCIAPLSVFHAHAYDAANILLDAIEAVAVEDGDSLTIDRAALRLLDPDRCRQWQDLL